MLMNVITFTKLFAFINHLYCRKFDIKSANKNSSIRQFPHAVDKKKASSLENHINY